MPSHIKNTGHGIYVQHIATHGDKGCEICHGAYDRHPKINVAHNFTKESTPIGRQEKHGGDDLEVHSYLENFPAVGNSPYHCWDCENTEAKANEEAHDDGGTEPSDGRLEPLVGDQRCDGEDRGGWIGEDEVGLEGVGEEGAGRGDAHGTDGIERCCYGGFVRWGVHHTLQCYDVRDGSGRHGRRAFKLKFPKP